MGCSDLLPKYYAEHQNTRQFANMCQALRKEGWVGESGGGEDVIRFVRYVINYRGKHLYAALGMAHTGGCHKECAWL